MYRNELPLILDVDRLYALVTASSSPSLRFDQKAESLTTTSALKSCSPSPLDDGGDPKNPFFSNFVRVIVADAALPIVPPLIEIPETELCENVESSTVITPPLIFNIPDVSPPTPPPP